MFVSSQASDTDLGSQTPKKVLSKGIFFGRVDKEEARTKAHLDPSPGPSYVYLRFGTTH